MADGRLCDQKACNYQKTGDFKVAPWSWRDFLEKTRKAQSTTISNREFLHSKGNNQ